MESALPMARDGIGKAAGDGDGLRERGRGIAKR